MATKAKSRWHGELEGIEDGLVFGWCVDADDAASRVVLDICINGETSGTLIADVARTDLHARFKKAAGNGVDPCHGFVADLRVHALDLPGIVTARVANTAHVLPGRVANDVRTTPPPPANTFVFSDGGLRVHGWRKHRDGQAATVRAYVGAREVARATADHRHPTLRAFGMEADGFVLDLPPELADGQPHAVRVVDERGVPLNGSPVTVCCFLTGASALLPRSGTHTALRAVIESYERYVPRSVGLGFYPAWRREFEPDAKPAAAKERVGIVVTGDDAQAAKRTRTSLQAQAGAKCATFTSVREALDSRCDAIGFVRAGDELRAHALATALEGFKDKAAQVVYTDSEYAGRPWFKPAWNLDYALASDYPLELMLVRRAFAARHLPPRADSAHSSTIAWSWLAHAAATGPQAIVHVPRAVYVWNAPPSAAEAHKRLAAAQAALATIDSKARLAPIPADEPLFIPRRVVRTLSAVERKTSVTLIVPTRDRAELLSRCLDSIRKHTKWASLEIIVVDNDSVQPETHRLLRAEKRRGLRVMEYPGAFNFSAMNNRAVQLAKGSVVGLINNDIEALHDDWLAEIVAQLLRPGIGAVGAKLVWPNGMVQHGGVLLGVGNAAGHFGNRLADADWGDHGRNQLALQVSGVTAACLFLRKKDYIAVGGMDEHAFPVTFNDVDLCLKLRARGDAIVWTPFARLLHAESASRGKEDAPPQRARAQRELDGLRERWGSVLLRDPAYHPSLNLDPHSHPFSGLAIPPRDRAPRGGTLPT